MDRNDNKGFWDRWAKHYDRTISLEKNTYAQILRRMKEKLHFSVQDATALPYAPETFDAVTISNALHIMPFPKKALAEDGYIFVDGAYEVHLKVKGRRVAEDTYERHDTFRRFLMSLGVDEKTAAADACEMEHAVSQSSYEALKALAEKAKRESVR